MEKALPSVTGILAGISVSIAGNMHYVVYGQIIPFIRKLKGEEVSSYWFPDATRYIGFNPDVEDKTIHEFPCYSFVLGDLHAHVVDIMFVLLLLGLLYAWMKKVRTTELSGESMRRKQFWKKQLLMPQLLAAGALLGMFHWTKLLGFCNLFCGDLRSGTVYEYHRAEGKNQMGARSDCGAGSGNSDTGNGDHSAVYVTV